MAALLVAMSIMAVMLTVAMPVWKHANQREKEEELVFRGLQYVHAIGMFQRKYANAYPPNIDVLVEQRFLRKKFKDPITNDDFVIIPVGQGAPGSAPSGQRGGAATTGRGAAGVNPVGPPSGGFSTTGAATSPAGQRSSLSSSGTQGGSAGIQTTAGISGVTSKSKEQSIRLYNGRGHYNEWAFVYIPQMQAPGQGAPGTGFPGQRGQPNQPGQRGQPPGTDPFGPGRGRPGGPGNPNPFGPNNPPGGRGFGPGTAPVQPIFGPQPTPRGRQ
jgi:type II secretory pathway pseudopilin PulG